MGMDASVAVTFYDSDHKVIDRCYLDCYKLQAACESFDVPQRTVEIRVCFTTEYDDHNCSSSEEESDEKS